MLNNLSHTLVLSLAELGTVRSLSLAIMVRYNDYTGFATLQCEPALYDNPESYFRDAQAHALFSKYKSLSITGVDRKAAAMKKWWEAERQCFRSNERLSPFIFQSSDEDQKGIASFFDAVRKKIISWIGPCPPDLDKIEGRFGPGATFSDKGRLTAVPDKMSSSPTLTPSAYWYLLPYMQTKWGSNASSDGRNPEYVRGNRFSLVPKNWKTDRAIAIEPAINVFYQLGLGKSIRRRLSTNAGWDLLGAQEVHRRIARDASRTGEFATLDLSSASDTVCTNLVKLLLPHRWFEELNALRSPATLIDGRWVVLEKFSSMGNGYTFELETLIFAALASTLLESKGASGVLGSDLYVYGDDIIVPTEHANCVKAVLQFCGFTLNQDKSFITGPFRESCGGDYWNGYDVRPWFRKSDIVQPLDIIKDANGWYSFQRKLRQFKPEFVSKAHQAMVMEIPLPYRRFKGPEQLGDIVIHSPESEWRYTWKHSIRTFKCVSISSRHLPWHHWKPDIVLASALYGVGDGKLGVIPRDPPKRYVVNKVCWS